MYSLCLQMFRRNSNPSFQDLETSYSTHQNFAWQVLSFYDGLCINKIENGINVSKGDDYCKECTSKCSLREMAGHCEKRKLFLVGEKDEWNSAWTNKQPFQSPLSNSPFISLIAIKSIAREAHIHPKQIIDYVNSALSVEFFNKTHPDETFNGTIFYQVFYSIGINDVFILLHLEDINDIENIVSALHKRFLESSKPNQYIQTYSIIGINRRFILPPSPPHIATVNIPSVLSQEYTFLIRLLTLPGINFSEAEQIIDKALQEENISKQSYKINSIMGSYDLELHITIPLSSYIRLLQPGKLLGWDSAIVLRSNTHIHFDENRKNNYFQRDITFDSALSTCSKAYEYYRKISTECQTWRKLRWDELEKILPNERDSLWNNFISSYVLACQRIATPQTWGNFTDIKHYIENYIALLSSVHQEIESMKNEGKDEKLINHAKYNLRNSLAVMTHDLYMLANERLSIEFPSSEKNSTNIYEKGAYEKLIQCWSKWIDQLSALGNRLSASVRKHAYAIIPYTYCQTKSINHLPENHSLSRAITIKLSVHEMFNIKELLLTFAHEVGHYTGLVNRDYRKDIYLICFINSTLEKVKPVLYPHHVQNTYEEKWLNDLTQLLLEYFQKKLTKIPPYLEDSSHVLKQATNELFDYNDKEGSELLNTAMLLYPGLQNPTRKSNFKKAFISCAERSIQEYRLILRELCADLFMLYTTNAELSDYLQIIARQTQEHMGFWNFGSSADSEFTSFELTLTMRILASIITFYSPNTENWSQFLQTKLYQFIRNGDECLKAFSRFLLPSCTKLRTNKCLMFLCEYGKEVTRTYASFGAANSHTKRIYECIRSIDVGARLHRFFSEIEVISNE